MNSEKPYTNSPKHFFDTYALIEIFEGNEAYSKYFDREFFITKLNLFEFHYYLLRKISSEEADKIIGGFIPNITEFDTQIVKKASKFRLLYKSRGLSMTDCIGYVYARENGLKFVTGDKEFRKMENAEFTK